MSNNIAVFFGDTILILLSVLVVINVYAVIRIWDIEQKLDMLDRRIFLISQRLDSLKLDTSEVCGYAKMVLDVVDANNKKKQMEEEKDDV